jgi:hypothetical protein
MLSYKTVRLNERDALGLSSASGAGRLAPGLWNDRAFMALLSGEPKARTE